MNGRFLMGALTGGVLVVGGLMVGSVLFPPQTPAPTEPAPASQPAVPEPAPETPAQSPQEPVPTPTPEPAPEPAPAAAPLPEAGTKTDAVAAPVTTDTAVAAAVAPEPTGQDTAAEAKPPAAPQPQAEAGPSLSGADIAPGVPNTEENQLEPGPQAKGLAEVVQPTLPSAPLGLPQLDTDTVIAAQDKVAKPLPDAGATSEAATADTPAETVPPVASAAPIPASDQDEMAEMPGEQPERLIEPKQDAPLPEVAELPEAPTLRPAPGLGSGAEGVIVRRLPQVGDPPPVEAGAGEAGAGAAGMAENPGDDRPIMRFAATFENPDGRPLMSVVLIDSGRDDLDRAALAALPMPLTFALDPLDPRTPERAAIYRAAGKEVVMLATGIAEGATAADIEVAFQSMEQGLPEAVAVMDLAQPVFQQRRPLASLVVPVIGAQGRGLLTWDHGLNAADQVARRDDVPAAVVFRDLTSAGNDRTAIRRILDRAVFKAGQDGRVVVAGEALPETVAALLEWSVEGRGATVAMAPLTAVLAVD
ncbi:divergent polysaccharide deacetylase family protein [Tabrizicola sp. YIM 78059]|uniref:divergent polysaccharide deacetylase family protein n=1 Tax=Tabrizicola sp. YIM 78059 TaxID=2529861 RepID=UPI0010AA1257|nr:divergent polysaccharide deacetylase family protein [Tabrizicola sp. YIM 78059]